MATEAAQFSTWPNLVSMFFDQVACQGDRPFLWAVQNGVYRPLTWREVGGQVIALARALRRLGVGRGDRVALVSENRPEWLVADLAIMAAGGITTPSYTTNTVDDHRHVFTNSGARGVIVSTARLAERVLPAARQSPDSRFVIAIEPPALDQRLEVDILPWRDVLADGVAGDDIVAEASGLQRTDTACIIYTSGTGGVPKGVMLSHGAILHNVRGAFDALLELGLGDEVFLSFLPLSHSYEHTAGQFFPVSIGAQIYYAEGVEHLSRNMRETRPTIMTAVPRLYELMHGRITRTLDKEGGLKRSLFLKAVELGRLRHLGLRQLDLGERLLDGLLDRVVRAKVREGFGGRLKALVSGGAPLNPDVGLFFQALGVRVLQGYGLTESAPVISVNRPRRIKMHTVGPPLLDTEVRIAEDGEICVRGELVMQGYWRNPEATAAVLKDGWLHTGDIGRLDEDGYIQITDRKKDIIVNSGGDNISPQRIEGFLVLQPEIAQAMVYGDRRPHLVAVLVPDAEWAKSWAETRDRPADPTALAADPTFQDALRAAVERVNESLSTIEKVRRFVVADSPFTVDNGMMTPTMKIRRHVIRQNYGERLEALYARR